MLEGSLLLFIQEHLRFDFLTPLMTGVSAAGTAGICWIVLALGILLTGLILHFGVKKKTVSKQFILTGLAIGIALVFSLLITNLILKNAVGRVRPYDAITSLQILVPRESDSSFPSGHASAGFAASAALLLMLPKKKKWPGIIAVIFASLMAYSRLYVGVHYLSDVAAGIGVGIICAMLAVFIFSGCVLPKKAPRPPLRRQ